MECNLFDTDKLYENIRILQFPATYIGMGNITALQLNEHLNDVLLKTRIKNRFYTINEARNDSPVHRSFVIEEDIESNTLIVKFYPKEDTIRDPDKTRVEEKLVLIDLRVLKISGSQPCCSREEHLEIERIYICGTYEFCKIVLEPSQMNLGCVTYNSCIRKKVWIHNRSKVLGTRITITKALGIGYSPDNFYLAPLETGEVIFTIHALSGKLPPSIQFSAHAPDGIDNPVHFFLKIKANVKFDRRWIPRPIESLHKLTEINYDYALCPEEAARRNEYKLLSKNYIIHAKSHKPDHETSKTDSYLKRVIGCESVPALSIKSVSLICQKPETKMKGTDLLKVKCEPKAINFGVVGVNTTATETLKICNDSKFRIRVRLEENEFLRYNQDKSTTYKTKLGGKSCAFIAVHFFTDKTHEDFGDCFHYIINEDNRFEVNFRATVEMPKLEIHEKHLKFGMVSSDMFVTSVPVKIINKYNITMEYSWRVAGADTPIEFLPERSFVDPHSFRICSVLYSARDTKLKTFAMIFESNGVEKEIEVTITTKKNAIRFSELMLDFKDVPLNVEVTETIFLENVSREICTFQLTEDYAGITILPNRGVILPKMSVPFTVTMKIPLAIDILFDLCVKINNKDNVYVTISATIIAPKLAFMPKTVSVPRIMSGFIYEEMVVIQNLGKLKTYFKKLHIQNSPFKIVTKSKTNISPIDEFVLEGKQAISLCIQFYYPEVTAFDLMLPLVVNDIIYPTGFEREFEMPSIEDFESVYSPKGKAIALTKDMVMCRFHGIFLKGCLAIQPEHIQFDLVEGAAAKPIEITISNTVSRNIHVSIEIYNLPPLFQIENGDDDLVEMKEHTMEFDLGENNSKTLVASFFGSDKGAYYATAVMRLDNITSIPYNNLTLCANIKTPLLKVSPPVVFLNGLPNEVISVEVNLEAENITTGENIQFCIDQAENIISVKVDKNFLDEETKKIQIEISATSKCSASDICSVKFHTTSAVWAEVKVHYLITKCHLTRHVLLSMGPMKTVWPYVANSGVKSSYLMETKKKLEYWLYAQGYRKEMFPMIPDTFYHTAINMTAVRGQGLPSGPSLINFFRRVSGSTLKASRVKEVDSGVIGQAQHIMNILKIYEDIKRSVIKRGGLLGHIDVIFLLGFDDFKTFHTTSWYELTKPMLSFCASLLKDKEWYLLLSTQTWVDFILQIYKAFVLNNQIFFDLNSDDQLENCFITWYNTSIETEYHKLFNSSSKIKSVKLLNSPYLKNFTTDLSDGLAFAAVTLKYCPFMLPYFNGFAKVASSNEREASIIHNANILIEVWQTLRLNFPLESHDLLEPNYVQMILLSVHLFVILPTMEIKDELLFSPPLGQTSTRLLTVAPLTNEHIPYGFSLLLDNHNQFSVSKNSQDGEGDKKKQESPKFLIKYCAHFVHASTAILVFSGCNKVRLFDSFVVTKLKGAVGSFQPLQTVKVSISINRCSKIDIMVKSPFLLTSTFAISASNNEPSLVEPFEKQRKTNLYFRRVNFNEKIILLPGIGDPMPEQDKTKKISATMACISPSAKFFWVWFRSPVGDFFIKLICTLKTEVTLDSFEISLPSWPMPTCGCDLPCECDSMIYLLIPQMNFDLLSLFRSSLSWNASPNAMHLYDTFINSLVGRIIIKGILLDEGMNMEEIGHIFNEKVTFSIKSKTLKPQLDKVVLYTHSRDAIRLPVTLPADMNIDERHFITLTSECGRDLRTYRIIFANEE